MIDPKNIALVVIGSAAGGTLRYLFSVLFQQKEWNKLPWATFSVNILGCFLIGMVYAITEKANENGNPFRLLLATGFCGGFTTFSAFAQENLQLLKSNANTTALLYITLSVVLGIFATFLGMTLFK
ncbi:MAG: Protein of unknown function CrcB [Bacteroidota bacterium]|jgi:CrcB protein